MLNEELETPDDLGYAVEPFTLEAFRSEGLLDLPEPTTLEDW